MDPQDWLLTDSQLSFFILLAWKKEKNKPTVGSQPRLRHKIAKAQTNPHPLGWSWVRATFRACKIAHSNGVKDNRTSSIQNNILYIKDKWGTTLVGPTTDDFPIITYIHIALMTKPRQGEIQRLNGIVSCIHKRNPLNVIHKQSKGSAFIDGTAARQCEEVPISAIVSPATTKWSLLVGPKAHSNEHLLTEGL